jgi:hypothetical protein
MAYDVRQGIRGVELFAPLQRINLQKSDRPYKSVRLENNGLTKVLGNGERPLTTIRVTHTAALGLTDKGTRLRGG